MIAWMRPWGIYKAHKGVTVLTLEVENDWDLGCVGSPFEVGRTFYASADPTARLLVNPACLVVWARNVSFLSCLGFATESAVKIPMVLAASE